MVSESSHGRFPELCADTGLTIDVDDSVISSRGIFHQLAVTKCRVSTVTGISVLPKMLWAGLSVWKGGIE